MTEMLPAKAPADVLDYLVDATGLLSAGETIVSSGSSVVVTGGNKDSEAYTSTGVTVWISGGTAGTLIRLTATLRTSGGRTFQQVYIIPYGEPISLSEIKQHLRLEADYTEEDELLSSMITAARRSCERYLNRSVIGATRTAVFTGFPSYPYQVTGQVPARSQLLLFLAGGTVASISSITYVDTSGASQTLDVSQYEFDASSSFLAPTGVWPTAYDRPDAVRVTYTVSPLDYDDAMAVSQAMKLIIGGWYRSREGHSLDQRGVPVELPHSVSWLLDGLRAIPFR